MTTKSALFATFFSLLSAAPAMGQQTATMYGPADGEDLAPTAVDRVEIGQPAPDFTLERHGGGSWTLSDREGERNAVLVFFRGHWCPYCMDQLAELTMLLDAQETRDTELVVISVEGEALTRQTIDRITKKAGVEPEFTFLYDPDSAVIGRYGILNSSGSRRGIPHPAVFVVDRDGIVRWRDVQTDYRVRPSNADIRAALAGLDADS